MSDRTFRLQPSDIDQAFERNEFCVVFQPKVDLTSERMTGAEVFVRWQHPQFGLLPPGLFLDFIESRGRMPDLTGLVFHSALEGAQRWKAQGKDWTVSINVAPGTVTTAGFAEGLAGLLTEYELEPQRVIIEVPERAIATAPERLCEALLEVREMGVHVALDGGGIVPVDLTQFVPMPFTSIKVGGPASIRLAHRLGLQGKGAIAARLRFARQHQFEAVAVGADGDRGEGAGRDGGPRMRRGGGASGRCRRAMATRGLVSGTRPGSPGAKFVASGDRTPARGSMRSPPRCSRLSRRLLIVRVRSDRAATIP